jgi:EAL domain-containing protein (putative c-di-GMP-specific phosphodiesterase class I)
MLLSLARDFGCELILEGIEQASTANAAEDMKTRYGQGYLFGHPTEASAWSSENQYQARRS